MRTVRWPKIIGVDTRGRTHFHANETADNAAQEPLRLVDGEHFLVRARQGVPGQYDFDCVAGPNPGHGFMSTMTWTPGRLKRASTRAFQAQRSSTIVEVLRSGRLVAPDPEGPSTPSAGT
jgi:hypothetical protein